jgi:hypothetical protein
MQRCAGWPGKSPTEHGIASPWNHCHCKGAHMISEVLLFLKDHLNAYLSTKSGWSPETSQEDKVVFIDGENMDPISFKLGAISAVLINIEEDNTLRGPDPYRLSDGA